MHSVNCIGLFTKPVRHTPLKIWYYHSRYYFYSMRQLFLCICYSTGYSDGGQGGLCMASLLKITGFGKSWELAIVLNFSIFNFFSINCKAQNLTVSRGYTSTMKLSAIINLWFAPTCLRTSCGCLSLHKHML